MGIAPATGRQDTPTDAERRAMGTAIGLATGRRTGRNPRVGCVLLDAHGEVLAQGVHRGPGTPHAEVAALAGLDTRARPFCAVVTLEPCRHQGFTPPCTDALLRAGIRRVVFGVADPDPGAGGGAEVLRANGVDVVGGVRAAECEGVDPGWFAAARLGRPHVTWKTATTLDGRVAARDGSSRWISSTLSRAHAHRLRSDSDAVVVGTGTALVDDPRLTVRDADTEGQPLRVVVGHRDIPAGAALRDDAAPLLHLRTHDPREVLDTLWDQGVRRVLLEGGPTLAAAFVGADLVDRVVAFVAPKLLGAGPAGLADAGIGTIDQAVELEVTGIEGSGGDVMVTAKRRGGN